MIYEPFGLVHQWGNPADAPGYATHEVLNQAGVLADYNAYTDDKPLVDAMRVFGADLICP